MQKGDQVDESADYRCHNDAKKVISMAKVSIIGVKVAITARVTYTQVSFAAPKNVKRADLQN